MAILHLAGATSTCEVHFTSQGDDGVRVDIPDAFAQACREYCGARATFDGLYLRPPPKCRDAEVKKARAAFKREYGAHRYAAARAVLEPVLQKCSRVLDRFEASEIRNHLAVTLHHLGDDAGCTRVLEPLRDLAETPPNEVGDGEPAYQDELRKLARATRTNLALCRPTAKPRRTP